MSIVRLPEYEAEFEPEVFEIYALPRSDANGASPYLEKYHRPLVSTDAILDTRTGVLDRSEGILTWIIEGLDDRWGYSFEPHGVYKLLVKKAKPLEDLGYMRPSWNNRYYVLEVLEEHAKHSELEALSAYLKTPKYLHTDRGDFLLNREYQYYGLRIDDYAFTLDVDEGSDESCTVALEAFNKIDNFKEFEQRISTYISETLLDLANDWLDNDDQDPITAEIFAKRITMGELAFRNDGTIEVYYDDDDIFWGHCIIANIDADGNPDDMMDEPIDIKMVSNGKAYGDDIVLQKGDKELQIPYVDEQDRDVTIKYFNDFVKPDYEVRWFAESLGNDTLGFTVLSGAEWANLEDEFGADTVRYYFDPINLESNMFNLDMDEVSALLELRENNR